MFKELVVSKKVLSTRYVTNRVTYRRIWAQEKACESQWRLVQSSWCWAAVTLIWIRPQRPLAYSIMTSDSAVHSSIPTVVRRCRTNAACKNKISCERSLSVLLNVFWSVFCPWLMKCAVVHLHYKACVITECVQVCERPPRLCLRLSAGSFIFINAGRSSFCELKSCSPAWLQLGENKRRRRKRRGTRGSGSTQ